jgi:3-oxoacyl-[acyl-carrier-protein] synthase III
MKAYIKSVGVYLPKTVLTNAELETRMDTSDEWIRSRTGIRERRIEQDLGLMSSDIGTNAAREALARANLTVDDVDGIIAGSIYPDAQLPAMACIIQKKLGVKNGFAFDITAACAFFPFGLITAANMIESGQAKNILVIGAELCSRAVDWTDRNTCVLFGDGAGAMLLSGTEDPNRGFVTGALKSRGDLDEILYMNAMGSKDAYLRMEGTQVFKLAVSEIPNITIDALEKAGLTTDDLDLLVPHQANIRILEGAAKRLKISTDKIMINVHRYGNTSSASIPIALYEALEEGKLKKGNLVAFAGIGAGMSWGCALFRW